MSIFSSTRAAPHSSASAPAPLAPRCPAASAAVARSAARRWPSTSWPNLPASGASIAGAPRMRDLRFASLRVPRILLRVDAVGKAWARVEAGPGQVCADGDPHRASRGVRRSGHALGVEASALLSGPVAVGARARRRPVLVVAGGGRVDRAAVHHHPARWREGPGDRRGGRRSPDRPHDDGCRPGSMSPRSSARAHRPRPRPMHDPIEAFAAARSADGCKKFERKTRPPGRSACAPAKNRYSARLRRMAAHRRRPCTMQGLGIGAPSKTILEISRNRCRNGCP